MIATSDFYSTTTGCNRDCLCCTMTCDVVVIYRSAGTVVTTTKEDRRFASSLDTRYTPEKKEKEEYLYILINKEEIRLRRKEALRKSRYRNPFNRKPSLKRRILFSKSGWLTRKGRLRKKGKK